jgi:hypothetical protein
VKINTEIGQLVDTAINTKLMQLKKIVSEQNLPENVVGNIFSSLGECEDPVSNTFKLFKTPKLVESYLKANFHYVAPTTVKLGSGTFQYIPVTETLAKVQGDTTFQRMRKRHSSQIGDGEGFLLEDIDDGLIFKENRFFLQNPNALKLMLYSDVVQGS